MGSVKNVLYRTTYNTSTIEIPFAEYRSQPRKFLDSDLSTTEKSMYTANIIVNPSPKPTFVKYDGYITFPEKLLYRFDVVGNNTTSYCTVYLYPANTTLRDSITPADPECVFDFNINYSCE